MLHIKSLLMLALWTAAWNTPAEAAPATTAAPVITPPTPSAAPAPAPAPAPTRIQPAGAADVQSPSGLVDWLVRMAEDYGARVLGILFLLAVAWIIGGILGRLISRGMVRAKLDVTVTKFVAAATRWVVMVLAAIGCLGVFGVQTTSFAALIGAGGLAIGLAMQGALSSLAASIMLLIFRPFRVGDFVVVAGQTGIVDEIGLFSTVLNTPDNRRVIIPNAQIFGQVIENMTANAIRRADVSVGVSYCADIDATRGALERAAARVPKQIPDRSAQVVLMALGASSVDWQVRIWCSTEDLGEVRGLAIRAIKIELDAAEISIPYPQMDVHLDGQLRTIRG